MMNETSRQIRTTIAQRQEQSDRKDMQGLCRNLSQKVSDLRRRITSLSEFCEKYNPDRQLQYTDPDEVFKNADKAATLHDISNAYHENAGATWLVPQLANLSEFCGVRHKITDEQIEHLARLIETQYGYLTVPEIMLFLFRFKAGKYGEFYGNVDPMVITSSLGVFIDWRNKKLDDIRAMEITQKTWNSYEEYKEAARRQAQYIASQKSKSIGFTARSDKTKVNAIGDIMRDMTK